MKLVFLRGLGRETQHWAGFTGLVKNKLQTSLNLDSNKIKTYTPDSEGCGVFSHIKSSRDIGSLCEHMRTQILKKCENTHSDTSHDKESRGGQKLILIGISMGGMIALDWQHRYPDEIHAAIIINSSCNNVAWYQRLRLQSLFHLIIALISPMEKRESRVLNLVSNRHDATALHLDHWHNIQKQHPVNRATLIKQVIAASKFTLPQVQALSLGLIISSQTDRLVSNKCSHYIAHQTNWPHYIHPWAGHDLALDDPEWLSNCIAEWIKTA